MGDGFAFFDLIIFAMLAGYLVFQLRRVLGRRTGHQQRRPNAFARKQQDAADNDNDAVSGERATTYLPSGDTEDEELSGQTRLSAEDPDFDPRTFVQGAKAAFEWIVTAFARGDRDTLRGLLGPSLYKDFEAAIAQREQAGETLETTVAAIKSASIGDVRLEGSVASITVEFITDQVKVVRDSTDTVIEGDPHRIETLTDLWVFSRDVRSPDPNWHLIATQEPEEDPD